MGCLPAKSLKRVLKNRNSEVTSLTILGGLECARPRAQHRTKVGALTTNGAPSVVQELLRPRTGALRAPNKLSLLTPGDDEASSGCTLCASCRVWLGLTPRFSGVGGRRQRTSTVLTVFAGSTAEAEAPRVYSFGKSRCARADACSVLFLFLHFLWQFAMNLCIL